VGALKRELDDNDVAVEIDVVQLTMHVGESPPVVLDGVGDLIGRAACDPDRVVREHSIGVEAGDPSRDIFDLGDLVCVTDEFFVVHLL
jgi:hypothetical protein